jgi:hypothetical protein
MGSNYPFHAWPPHPLGTCGHFSVQRASDSESDVSKDAMRSAHRGFKPRSSGKCLTPHFPSQARMQTARGKKQVDTEYSLQGPGLSLGPPTQAQLPSTSPHLEMQKQPASRKRISSPFPRLCPDVPCQC